MPPATEITPPGRARYGSRLMTGFKLVCLKYCHQVVFLDQRNSLTVKAIKRRAGIGAVWCER